MFNASDEFQIFKQTNEYNCAAGAVAYFVFKQSGLVLNVDQVANKLGCGLERGTTHGAIIGYLDYLYRYDNYKIIESHELLISKVDLPLIVNYWDGEDGHYGVLFEVHLRGDSPLCWLFNPWTGREEPQYWEEFRKNWYSPRYGRNWGLYIAKDHSIHPEMKGK